MAESFGGGPGEEVCLDFHNTMAGRPGSDRSDPLGADLDAMEWFNPAGLGLALATGGGSGVRGLAARAQRLREHLHRLLLPLASWHAPAPEDLETFNRFIPMATARLSLTRGRGRFDWTFSRKGGTLDPALAEVVWSAAKLLTSPDLRRLRVCGDPDCGRLFLDRSRRGNRRWCAMAQCGNRAKARRYYARRRAGRITPIL